MIRPGAGSPTVEDYPPARRVRGDRATPYGPDDIAAPVEIGSGSDDILCHGKRDHEWHSELYLSDTMLARRPEQQQDIRRGAGLPTRRDSIAGRSELHGIDVPIGGGGMVCSHAPLPVGTPGSDLGGIDLAVNARATQNAASPPLSAAAIHASGSLRRMCSTTSSPGNAEDHNQLPIASKASAKFKCIYLPPNPPASRLASGLTGITWPAIKAPCQVALTIRTQTTTATLKSFPRGKDTRPLQCARSLIMADRQADYTADDHSVYLAQSAIVYDNSIINFAQIGIAEC